MRAGLFACFILAALSAAVPAEAQKQVNVYNWSDYIALDQLAGFSKETGIKVNYTTYDSNEILDAKLKTGHSGYDVVVPTASPFLVRQLAAHLYQPLDKNKLNNLRNLDPRIMAQLARYDHGNAHAIPWMWGTIGVGYNEQMVKALMPDVPVDSWRLVFDPAIASKITKCGISVLDDPAAMMRAVLPYLGRDPNSQKSEDRTAAEAALLKIRPYIRNINSSEYIEALANGDLCVAVGYNGDVLQARDRSREANKGVVIKYFVPKEGSVLWIDMLAIPRDAPDRESAYAFVNYMMTPQVIAEVSNFKRFANANAAAQSLVLVDVRNDSNIYPPPDLLRQLPVELADTPEQSRAITRMWQKFKTGQ